MPAIGHLVVGLATARYVETPRKLPRIVWLGGLVTVAGGFISAQARTARKRAEVAAGV